MDLNFISEHNGEIVFSARERKYIGLPSETHLASLFIHLTTYQLQEATIANELPESLRAVTVDYLIEPSKYLLKWRSYFNANPSEPEKEIMTAIFGYALAEMPNITNSNIQFDIEEEYLTEPYPNLMTKLKCWAYIKSEPKVRRKEETK